MAVFPSFKLTKKGEELLNRSIGEGKVLTFTKFEIGDGNPPSDFREQTSLVNKFYQFPVLSTDIQKNQILRIKGYFDNKSFTGDKQLKEIGVFVKIENDETEYLYSYTNAGESGDIIPGNTRGFYSRTLDVANYIGYATNITFNIEQLRDRYAFNSENEMKVASYLKEGDKVELWGNLVLGDKPVDEYIVQRTGEVKLYNGLYAKKVSFKYTAGTIEEMQKLSLKVGDVVELLGYYTAGDGAGHKRVIASGDDGSGVLLENGLYANIVHDGEVNVSWFGGKYNSLESARSNYTNLLRAINYNQSVNITRDLYIEQNGDNVVTSENLILKGKDEAKLIFGNGDKADYFFINNNKNNIGFNDLVITFNEKKSLNTIQILSVSGMIKIKKIEVKRCFFKIETQARLIEWLDIDLNVKPDINLHGIDTFDITENKFINPQISFVKMFNVIYKEFVFKNNYVNNFSYAFIKFLTTNGTTYENQISYNKVISRIEGNTVINDDDYIFNSDEPGDKNTYFCLALIEGRFMFYKNNYVEGIKSKSITALYDIYFSGESIYYENNTYKNNLCFNKDKTHAVLMKSKETKYRYYFGNTFLIEESFVKRHEVDSKALWVKIDQKLDVPGETVIRNNYINVPHLRLYELRPYTTNFTFTDNKIKSSETTGYLFSFDYLLEDSKRTYISQGNIIDLGILKSEALFAAGNSEKKYDSIIIENNNITFTIDSTVQAFDMIASSFKSKYISINNNNFININDNDTTKYHLFDPNKSVSVDKLIALNNVFSLTPSANNENFTWLMTSIVPASDSVVRLNYKILNKGKLNYIFKGFLKNENQDMNKKLYYIKFDMLKESKKEEYYLYFSLEKKMGVHYIEYYTKLGEITNEILSFQSSDRKNMYLFNENNTITNEFIQIQAFNAETEELRFLFGIEQDFVYASIDFNIN